MLTDKQTDILLKASLREDIGQGDLTAELIPEGRSAKADFAFEEAGVLCGLPIVERMFRMLDADLRFLPAASEGDSIEPGRVVAYIEGRARTIVTGERTALNFLCHLSGIATFTRRFVDRVSGTPARIYHTRKTTPLLRRLERDAVIAGGGFPHRQGLYDGILIKDNHWRFLSTKQARNHVLEARRGHDKSVQVGIEVDDLASLAEMISSGCDYILLDNFSVESVQEAVRLREKLKTHVPFEVSGRVNLDNVRGYAECGIERISIGSLTHSPPNIDISLHIIGA